MSLKQIGSLWKKTGKRGDYLAGEIDLGLMGKVKVAIFPNELDEADKEKNKPNASIVLFEE